MKRITLVLCSLLVLLVFSSCKDDRSIETYFVEHQELPDYRSLDLSTDLFDIEEVDLTPEELKAYKAIKKLHLLVYKAKKESSTEAYNKAFDKVNYVFTNPKYSELMTFKDYGTSFSVSTIDDSDNDINEVLVLVSNQTYGFALGRLIGDDIKPKYISQLIGKLKNTDVSSAKLENFVKDFIKE